MKYRSLVGRILILFIGLGLLTFALAVPGTTLTNAAIDVSDASKWEPLQNPEPDARNNISYSKLCAITETGWNNVQTKPAENTSWFDRSMDICTLASGGAQIHPIRKPAEEAQGYYTYEASFNMIGSLTDWQYTSDPSFHLLWGKNWDLDAVAFQPLSAFEGWGTASRPINGITQSFDLNVCRQHKWGYCQPENITWDWTDPNNPGAGKDDERFRKPILHLPSNSGNWQSFLMEGDGYEWTGTKWWKPELWSLKRIQTSPSSSINSPQAIADAVGGDFSLEYDTQNNKGNKKGKFLFRVKRKPGVPASEKPFVGAVYKSWDKNDMWNMAQFLTVDPKTQEYYEPLRVEEKLQKNSYTAGKKIPAHEFNIHYQNDDTAYWKSSVPGRNNATCQVEDYYLKQYRYKVFDKPDQNNPFAILSLRDPNTGQVSDFVTKVDPFNRENIWWETRYRGYKVVLRGDKFKDRDGVNNWRMEWIPEANTPNDPDLKTITIDMKFDERRMQLDKSKPAAAHPVITLKDQTGKPMPANYPAVVEVTKPDNTKRTYETKTNGQGVLVDTNGNTLATDTTVTGNYTIKVINTGKEKTPVDNCVTVVNSYNTYEIYPADRYIEVQKVDAQDSRLQDSRFAIYADKDGKPDIAAGSVTSLLPPDGKPEANGKATNGSWITYKPLNIGKKYWLVETKAPFAHQLALPIPFTVAEDKILLGNAKSDQYTAIVTGNKATPITDTARFPAGTKVQDYHVIKVQDVKAGKLPASGGKGVGIYLLLGLALVIVAYLLNRKNSDS